jgi:hypothetical protein
MIAYNMKNSTPLPSFSYLDLITIAMRMKKSKRVRT